MFVFFAEDTNLVKDGMFDDDVVGILKGVVKANTHRVWTYIAEELFGAFENGQDDPHIAAFDGGLFEKPLHKSAFFPDKEKRGFSTRWATILAATPTRGSTSRASPKRCAASLA